MIIGLTGSIAMGKSTVAKMFKELGYPVFDADDAVHKLYKRGGRAAIEIAKIFPDAMNDGTVERSVLAELVSQDKTVLPQIEKIVHPMVHALEKEFISNNNQSGAKIILLDIPLLFETDRSKDVDVIVVVSATKEQQRSRALQRQGMTQDKLDLIMSRQLPDREKRKRANYIIDTSTSINDTFEQVKHLIVKLLCNKTAQEN